MKRLRRFINTTLLGGFVVLLPLAIFIVLAKTLIGLVNQLLQPIANALHFYLKVELPQAFYHAIAFLVVVGIFFSLGLIVQTRIGKSIFDGFENRYLARLPFYSTIKKTVQQFSGVKKMPFSEVVLVDVYGSGVWMTGFVTAQHPDGFYTVFVPTAPNPTNGFIFHVTEERIRHTPQVKTEDAMRTIIGMGVGTQEVFEMKKFIERSGRDTASQ